ncbi:hypothetical protein PNC201_05810 [Pseudoalteromonas sp. NC201]|nr:hypothetical protein PNC201_05810 [Pseudoalteromonas sp. NC201]
MFDSSTFLQTLSTISLAHAIIRGKLEESYNLFSAYFTYKFKMPNSDHSSDQFITPENTGMKIARL